MKKTVQIGFILVTTAFLLTFCKKERDENFILIYNGPVADTYGVESVARMAEELGFSVSYISDPGQLPEMLDGAKAFVIGGTEGETSDLLDALYPVQEELKTFIKNGGSYLGICGGAYVASKGSQWDDGYETGMGLVNVESFAYDTVYFDSQIIPVSWLGNQRTIYYQYGPAFSSQALPADCEILARYNNQNQDVAIFTAHLGSGHVVLCGPHPEADSSWLIDDPEPLNAAAWTDTHDIFRYLFQELTAD